MIDVIYGTVATPKLLVVVKEEKNVKHKAITIHDVYGCGV
jgi:hypothetical protein